MPSGDLVQWGHDLPLPEGWRVYMVSVSRPIGFHFSSEGDLLEVRFSHMSGRVVDMEFRKAGFDPQWLHNYLSIMAMAPASVRSADYNDRW